MLKYKFILEAESILHNLEMLYSTEGKSAKYIVYNK
jgi:hypothetical protein